MTCFLLVCSYCWCLVQSYIVERFFRRSVPCQVSNTPLPMPLNCWGFRIPSIWCHYALFTGSWCFSFKLYTMVLISAPKKGEIPIPSFWLACLYQMLGGKNPPSTEVCPYVARLNEADRRNICGSFFLCVFFVLSVVLLRSHIPSNAFFVDWWTELPIYKKLQLCWLPGDHFPRSCWEGLSLLEGEEFLSWNFGIGHRHHRPSAKCTRNDFFHWDLTPNFPPGCNRHFRRIYYIFPQQQNAMFFFAQYRFLVTKSQA